MTPSIVTIVSLEFHIGCLSMIILMNYRLHPRFCLNSSQSHGTPTYNAQILHFRVMLQGS